MILASAELVKLRFFAGLSIDAAAAAPGYCRHDCHGGLGLRQELGCGRGAVVSRRQAP